MWMVAHDAKFSLWCRPRNHQFLKNSSHLDIDFLTFQLLFPTKMHNLFIVFMYHLVIACRKAGLGSSNHNGESFKCNALPKLCVILVIYIFSWLLGSTVLHDSLGNIHSCHTTTNKLRYSVQKYCNASRFLYSFFYSFRFLSFYSFRLSFLSFFEYTHYYNTKQWATRSV